MKKRLIVLTAVFVLASFILGCGGGTTTPVNTTKPLGTALALITVRDAPLSGILSAEVTISNVTLTSSSGATVAAISTLLKVELSRLGALDEPLGLASIPEGTYTGVSVTVSAVRVTYLDPSGTVVEKVATITSATGSTTFSPPIVITAASMAHLHLDFDLSKSFDLSGGAVSFTPVFSAQAENVDAENEQNKEDGITGKVTAISPTSITLQALGSGATFTFVIDSSTQFEDGTSPSSIAIGSVVTVESKVQKDGSLLAIQVDAGEKGQAEGPNDNAADGLVTAVNTSSGTLTSFQFVVQQELGGTHVGKPVTVNIVPTTTFASEHDAVGAGTPAFDASQIFPGQSIEVAGAGVDSLGTTIDARQSKQAALGLHGKLAAAPTGNSAAYTFTLKLDPSEPLAVLAGTTTLNAVTNPVTEFKGVDLTASSFGALAADTTLEFRGFLAKSSSGAFTYYITIIER